MQRGGAQAFADAAARALRDIEMPCSVTFQFSRLVHARQAPGRLKGTHVHVFYSQLMRVWDRSEHDRSQ